MQQIKEALEHLDKGGKILLDFSLASQHATSARTPVAASLRAKMQAGEGCGKAGRRG